MGKAILLLGVYGMEMVECGGALAVNARHGGKSFAAIMLAGRQMRENCLKAADILGVEKVYFNDFQRGEVDLRHDYKIALIKVIRETKPDIVITQDPEHVLHDLDPDRRPAMTLILEALALASRDYALDEIPNLSPHPIPKIYYMSPVNPNCTINVADVWDLKEKGMDVLVSQMEFSGHHFETNLSSRELEILAPGFVKMDNYYKKGRAVHSAIDKAIHMYYGVGGHGNFALAEPYRFEGKFEFTELM
ncbi:MAG: GlcNAc-PI de-N-acetylase [Spirochaetia bacterium]|nr:GlcNAc-PI de-N-acetylase [Spirochaetia bacterium]